MFEAVTSELAKWPRPLALGLSVELALLDCQIAIEVEDLRAAAAAVEASRLLAQGRCGFSAADHVYLEQVAAALLHYCETRKCGAVVLRLVQAKVVNRRMVSGHLKRNYPLPPTGSFV